MANRYWVGGTGTWNTTSTTNWSASSGGASGASVPTTADSVFFDQATTYTVTMTGALNCNDLTVSAGTVTFATGTTPTLNVAGSWSTIASTVWNSTGTITFTSSSATTINTNNITMDCSVTIARGNAAMTLLSNVTLSAATATRTLTLTSSNLSLGSYTFTCGAFNSSNINVRSLSFGTGKIVLNRNATATIWNTSTLTNLTTSGSKLIECIGGGTGVTKTITPGSGDVLNIFNFSLLETTGTATYTFTAGSYVKSLIFNGSQTVSNTAITVYGDFTHLTTNGTTTFTAGTNAWTFDKYLGDPTSTNTITASSGYTYDFPWTFSASNARSVTFALANNITLGTTRTLTLSSGVLSLGTYAFTCGIFNSANDGGREVNFGTGKIVLTRAATATIFNNTPTTSVKMYTSGTPLVECQGGGTGVTKTITSTQVTGPTITFSLLETTGTVTYTITASSYVSLLLNGTQTLSNTAFNIVDFTHLTTRTTTINAGANVWNFTGNGTITPASGVTYDFPWTFGGTSTSTYTLAGNLTIAPARTVTLTDGTLTLVTYTLTCGIFSASALTNYGINFGASGKIVLNGTATAAIWNLSASAAISGTNPLVECTGGGSAVTKTITNAYPSTGVPVSFSFLSPSGTSTYSFATYGTYSSCVNNLIINGVQTISGASGLIIHGSLTHSTAGGTSVVSLGNFTFATLDSTSATITTPAGFVYGLNWVRDINPVTGTGFGTVTLNNNVTLNDTFTIKGGTFSLGSYTLTALAVITGDSTVDTRTLDFGTGKIVINANTARVIWDGTYVANLTVTGSRTVECIGGGSAITKTINTGNLAAPACDFNFLETTGTVTYSIRDNATNLSVGYFRNLTCNGVQTVSFASGIRLYDGTFTHTNTNGTTTFSGPSLAFYGTTGTYTINSLAAYSYPFVMIFGNASPYNGATYALSKNLIATDITLSGGTLSLGTYTFSTNGTFDSTGTTARTLDFGTGKIVLNGNTTQTIWSITTSTNLTIAGTSLVECSGGGAAVTKTINNSGIVEANSVSFSLLETTGSVTYALTGPVDNLIVNGLQTVPSATLYGNFVYNNTNGTSSLGNTFTFSGASGTQTITSNGLTVDANFTINGTGGSVQLQDNLTVGVSRQLTFTSGTFDFNNKTYSGGGITILTPGATIANTGGTSVSLTSTITHTSGAFSLPCNVTTTSAYTFTAGTLTLGTSTLSVLNFAGQGNSVKTIAYGTGQLALTGNNTTILNLANATNLSSTGTVYINSTYTGATGTRGISTTNLTEAQIPGYGVSASGTSGIVLNTVATDTVQLTGSFEDVNLTGFSGTLSNSTRTIYGNLIIPASGGTYTAGVNVTSFRATSGVKTITTNGRTIDFALTFNGVGGTWQLQDALTMGSTRTLTHTNGTLDLNGKTLTVGASYTTAAGTKNLTFNGGTLVCPDVTTTAFNNSAQTGYTTTAGTGTGKISMTGATAKTFVGSGSTFNCTLSNDGAGALTITGSNTFTTLANGVQPTTFRFTTGSTTTVTNWNVSGTAGNLVTIISSTGGSAHTLSKSTGTVSSNYLSISDSTATGGAVWYAGANSTNGGNNTGWIFSGPVPSIQSGSFLLMFN